MSEFGIKNMAIAETWILNVVEDVKKALGRETVSRSYIATFVNSGARPLVLQSVGGEGTVTALASETLREEFIKKRAAIMRPGIEEGTKPGSDSAGSGSKQMSLRLGDSGSADSSATFEAAE